MQLFEIQISIINFTTVRLVGGPTKNEGRVEVYYNGQWGTVCHNGWDLNDTEVVCRQLGYGPAIAARYYAFTGQGSGQIWLADLECVGTELTIANCSHGGWGNHYCDHHEDVGVRCAGSNGMCII